MEAIVKLSEKELEALIPLIRTAHESGKTAEREAVAKWLEDYRHSFESSGALSFGRHFATAIRKGEHRKEPDEANP